MSRSTANPNQIAKVSRPCHLPQRQIILPDARLCGIPPGRLTYNLACACSE
jgi:hypothetical protein